MAAATPRPSLGADDDAAPASPSSPPAWTNRLLSGMPLDELWPLADRVGRRLRERSETLAVAEPSAGGLLSAALLSVPGASAYFLGSGVVYTRAARGALLGIPEEALASIRPSTEPYAPLLAYAVRERLGSSWGLAETGATGPQGNRYGDPPGHARLAVLGPTWTLLLL